MDKKRIEKLISYLLSEIGDNPDREGLKDTPKRVAQMFEEIFKGYDVKNKPKITTFPNGADNLTYDQMIMDEGDFYSYCEHHMVPFFGKYWFGYIPHPKGQLIGLSKVARVVDYQAAKLQIQERLVRQVVGTLWNNLRADKEFPEPVGMGLVMRGKHLCKCMRGVKKEGYMTTIELRGAFKDDAKAREEFLRFVK